jgi:hypothetical protein
MSDEIKKPEELEQAAESSTLLSEQDLEQPAGEAPLSEEELNKVAGGYVKPIGGKPVKYM